MKTRILIYGLILLFATDVFSQNNGQTYGLWNISSIDGEVKMRGQYRQRYTTLKDFSEFQESTYLSGGLRLNTKSFIWHPSFLQVDLGGEFYPESNQDDYLVTPDRAEVRTLKGLNAGATLFNGKPVTLSSWASWNDSYSNRDNLTDIRSDTRRWGSDLSLRNRILPLIMGYNSTKWDQREVQTGRTYKTEQDNFEASTRKSFTSRDRNELSYSHNRYFRRDANLFEVENMTDNIRLNNSLYLDEKKRYTFRSMIYNYNRYGSQNYSILSATENLTLNLPANFRFVGSYNLYNQQQESQRSHQDKFSASLNHKLFASLNTNLRYEYSAVTHTLYRETRSTGGFNFHYTKRIPTGRLNLSYSYSNLRNIMDSNPVDLEIINEEYYLADGEITMLSRPHIEQSTIVVKDVTGTIIYQDGFDYILIEQGDYMEIQRVPGGQIANQSTVYIDYMAIQTGSYKYNAISNNVTVSMILLDHWLEIYYRGQFVDYRNVEKSDLLVLNYIKRNTVGGKVNIKFVELGAEYEYQNSTITPYKMMRYFVNLQKRIEKVVLSLNGNIRDYDMVDEHINRKYSDLSGKAAYEFNPTTKIDLMLGYRHQKGPGIDLDLLTASSEFKTRYRQLHLTAGINLYRRNYLGDEYNYYSTYVQLVRKF
ncbi:MAG: hypothetical protein ABFS10_13045 [Bacteroidota bacterium]